VCVCSISCPACKSINHVVICYLSGSPIFFTFFHKWHDFREKGIEHKMCVLILILKIRRDGIINVHNSSCKSKGLPRQAELAQGVAGRLRPRIFLMFRHYKGGKSSDKRTGRLYPRRNPWYSLSEAEPTSGHVVLSGLPRKKFPVTPPGIDPGTVRLVSQRLNHYATPVFM